MPFKDAANSVLYRATGYLLTRETPEQRRKAVQRAAAKAARRAHRRTAENYRRKATQREARHQRQLAQQKARLQDRRRQRQKDAQAERERRTQQQATQQARHSHLPVQFDDVKREIISKALPRTMTGVPKLDPLVEATRYVVRNQIAGDIVECGVWRGGSMQAMALTLLSLGETSRELHLFDTFEGMPPPTAEDTRTRPSGETVTAAERLAASDRGSRLWAIAGLDDVREAMAETGYPSQRVHYHPGMVEDTTPGEAPPQIAILRLDTDWYASTKHELETLYERLSPGGILVLDDYGDWDGARKATDEWLDVTGEVLFLVPMGTGRIAVKPEAGGPKPK